MKRKRKEPVAGVNSRKFTGLKKSKMLKDVLKRPKMRGVTRSSVERILAGLGRYCAEVAKDRPAYGEEFQVAWNAAASSISESARKMLDDSKFCPVDAEYGLYPYGITFLVIFARLMDQLTYEEEETFRNILTGMDGAWGMYFSVIRMRWPRLSPLVDHAEEIREALQLEVQRLFFGEIVPALTARWRVAYNGLVKALELIGKEAKHDLA